MKDLAPDIVRQRLVIEGIPIQPILSPEIIDYLKKLSEAIGMTTLIEPVTHKSEQYGWAGWVHWDSSGAHFYAWERPLSFFSVDIYTCKVFDPQKAINFTKSYFGIKQLEYKQF